MTLVHIPRAFSYIRFSSKKQAEGDSLRRQLETAQAWADSAGIELDTRSFRDLGLSAYRGKNKEKGSGFALFLQAVEEKKVRRGDYLIVESLDRLSRQNVFTAQRLLSDLVMLGVIVHTTIDKETWTKETLSRPEKILYSVMLMARAHEESATKAKRVRDARVKERERARANGEVLTTNCPMWLQVNANRKFEIIPEMADSVRRVFAARINGLGHVAIARRANEEHWPAPSKTGVWHRGRIRAILDGRQVLGEHQFHTNETLELDDGDTRKFRQKQGDPVSNYFPAIIDEDTWQRARAVLARKKKIPGRRDARCRNILHGLIKCSCGGTLTRREKDGKAWKYQCTRRAQGLTQCPLVPVTGIEDAVLHAATHIRPGLMADAKLAAELATRHDLAEAKLAESKKSLTRLVAFISATDNPSPSIAAAVREAEAKRIQAEQELAAVAALAADQAAGENWLSVLQGAYVALESGEPERLSVIREALARVIKTIAVNSTELSIQIVFYGFPRPVLVRISDVPSGMRKAVTERKRTATEMTGSCSRVAHSVNSSSQTTCGKFVTSN